MKKTNKKDIYNVIKYIVIVGLFLSSMIFTYFYVRNESPIYIFDYSGYFENYKMMGNLLFSNVSEFLKLLWTSIREFDYNYSSVIPLMPFYRYWGASRFSYILSMVLIYVFPAILLISQSFMNIIRKDNKLSSKEDAIYYIFSIFLIFLYTRLWSPTLRGLSDIAGLLPIICSYMMIRKRPLVEKQKLRYVFLLGVVVYLPFLLRRWYVYYIIGFCVSSFLVDFFYFLTKNRKRETFFTSCINYAIFGGTILLLALFCQLPLLRSILSQNYSDAYSGYQTSLLGHLTGFFNEFGLIIIILTIIGLVLSFVRKKYYKDAVFATLNIVIFWVTFGAVQSMGVHHYLGISFWVILLVMIGIRHIFETSRFKLVFLCLILILFSCNFSTTYIFRDKSIPLISQNNKYYKFKYNNFGELMRLIHDAEDLLRDTDDIYDQNAKISVFADTDVLSDNILDLLGTIEIKDNIVYATHIDSRDGINFNSFFTQYVVATSISQLGTNPNGQYVMDIPNKMIYNDYGVGKAYQVVSGPYLLDAGVEAYIYEKERPLSDEEVEEYLEALYDLYPEWRDVYTSLDEALLEADVYLGSYYGSFRRMEQNKYFFFPGATDTEVTIPINEKLESIELRFYVDYSGNEEDSGRVDIKILADDKTMFDEEIYYKNDSSVVLDLAGVKKLKFVVSGGEILKDDWLLMDILDVNFGQQ